MRGRHIRRAVCCRERGDNIIRIRVVMLRKELNLLYVSHNTASLRLRTSDAIPFLE